MSVLDEKAAQSETEITPAALSELKATVPWMKFIAVLGFIGAGFTGIGALLSLFSGVIESAIFGLAIGGLYFFIAFNLFQYGNGISKFTFDKNPRTLEEAFAKQKVYWMILGILAIISIVLVIVLLASWASIMQWVMENAGGFGRF